MAPKLISHLVEHFFPNWPSGRGRIRKPTHPRINFWEELWEQVCDAQQRPFPTRALLTILVYHIRIFILHIIQILKPKNEG